MTDIPTLIESLKQEIAHKAKWYNVPFDEEDIEAHELYDGHWVVALMWIKKPYTRMDGERLVQRGTKTPNIDIAPLPPQFSGLQFEPTDDPFTVNVKAYVPKLTILMPTLVYLVFPDGTYKSGGTGLYNWLNAETEQKVEDSVNLALNLLKKRLKR